MKNANENFEVMKYMGGNPKLYFNKAIAIQNMAFKVEYAEKKLNQSCKTLIAAGYCGGCRDCKLCALQAAHDETIKALSNPEEAHKRYLLWLEKNTKLKPESYGAYRSKDAQGHETMVTVYEPMSPETKYKREVERRFEEMEQIAKSRSLRREQKDSLHKLISERDKRKAKWEAKKKDTDPKQNRYDSRWQ